MPNCTRYSTAPRSADRPRRGRWDSTGPEGGLSAKFQAAFGAEIVGLHAQIGRKVRSRIDPLQIERDAEMACILISCT